LLKFVDLNSTVLHTTVQVDVFKFHKVFHTIVS